MLLRASGTHAMQEKGKCSGGRKDAIHQGEQKGIAKPLTGGGGRERGKTEGRNRCCASNKEKAKRGTRVLTMKSRALINQEPVSKARA